MSWSPVQYSKFESERNRPVHDLLPRIGTTPVRRTADLGCGPGNSTELLHAYFPGSEITAIDSSPAMIDAARKRMPGVRFEVEDIAAWSNPGPFDVILANAVLQWVPDHESLLPRLLSKLSPGGSLAVQMPDNLGEPVHLLMREIAGPGPWDEARTELHSAGWYHRTLASCRLDVWRTTYYHRLANAAAITEWFKATGLRPYLDPLDPPAKARFLERYTDAVAKAYRALPDGTVLLASPRLFFVATLPI